LTIYLLKQKINRKKTKENKKTNDIDSKKENIDYCLDDLKIIIKIKNGGKNNENQS